MHLAAIAVFESDISEAKLQCKIAKEATPNFDLEKNLKAISTTTDTEFYNSFIDAVKLACAWHIIIYAMSLNEHQKLNNYKLFKLYLSKFESSRYNFR